MKRTAIRALLMLFVMAAWFFLAAGCDCGDDDDDDEGADDDDDDDDDAADDDDATDDDDDDDTGPPVMNMIPPVDYDGDGDAELLLMSIVETATDLSFRYYLVEPGTYERTQILEFIYDKPKGGGGAWMDVADFDRNGVWDLFFTMLMPGKSDYPVVQVFMNGDFDTPAFTVDSSAADSLYTYAMDADMDGYPELITEEYFSAADDYLVHTAFDPGDGWSEMWSIGDADDDIIILEGTQAPGDLFASAGNFSGTAKSPELVGVRYYIEAMTRYIQMIIFNAATGAEVASSTPINLGEAYYTNHDVADYDNDGVTEILIGKNYEVAKAIHYSQALIFGGKDFTVEYQSSQFNDYHLHLTGRGDFNMDQVVDPAFQFRSAMDSSVQYFTRNGMDDYTEMIHFTSSNTQITDMVRRLGRAYMPIGYDFTGQKGPEQILKEIDHTGEPTMGRFYILDLTTQMLSAAKHPIDLGDKGSLHTYVADLGGDSVFDLAVLAETKLTTDKGTTSNMFLYVLTGENMDESLATYLGTNPYLELYTYFDLTGDEKVDLLIRDYNSNPSEIYVYDCVGGCVMSGVITAEPDEGFMFLGPFL